jgi:hypothetical protein
LSSPKLSIEIRSFLKMTGGEGGIRTHGTRTGTTVFETVPIDRSGTSPELAGLIGRLIVFGNMGAQTAFSPALDACGRPVELPREKQRSAASGVSPPTITALRHYAQGHTHEHTSSGSQPAPSISWVLAADSGGLRAVKQRS